MAYENKWVITHYHPWYAQNWKGLSSFNGDNIWTDGTNIYHSQGSTQYVLNRTTNTWVPKTWNGLTSFYGTDIWSDGTDVYISNSSNQYVLDKTTDTWVTKTWSGLTSFNGYNIWTDGTDIYYSQGSSQRILNKTTSEWNTISWPHSINGRSVWTDGTNIYYSDTSLIGWHGIFDKTTKTWNEQTWSGLTSFDGYRVWTDGVDTYYSDNNVNYVLDKANNTWDSKTWSTPVPIDGLYIWHDGNKTYNSYGFRQYELGDSVTLIPTRQSYPKLIETKSFTSKWVSDTIASGWTSTFKAMDLAWPDMTSSQFIWTDGSDYYYSLDGANYVFDAETETWSTKTWTGLSSFRGNCVWHHNGHVYYSYESDQYELNLFTGEWVPKTWNNHVPENGNCVWHHNNTTYYGGNLSTKQWRLDDSTDTWEDITWDSSSATKTINGSQIWTDGVDTLLSSGLDSNKKWVAYVFNEASLKWTKKTYSGQTSSVFGLYGRYMWYHDGKIHFDYRGSGSSVANCFLNSNRNGWLPITWINGNNGAQMTPGDSLMFVCGDSCYWIKKSGSSGPYKLQKSISSKVPRRESYPELIETVAMPGEWLGDRVSITSGWAQKTWPGGASSSYGYNVWTDGEEIYYSSGSNHYVLDKTTSTWSTKTWTGLTSFNGINVWSDGENIYYSYDGTNYVLDKSTSTWSTKSWSGLSSFRGQYIWDDDDNVYYSYDNVNKVLNKNTGAWQNKLWNGCAYVNGYNVWKDGDTVYFSGGNDSQFVLNKATKTWEPKTWNGISIGSLTGQRIWTDGEDIYFSYGVGSQYILNRDTDTWERASWQSTNISSGTYVWTDGDSTYYSYGTTNLKFNKNITITTPRRLRFTPLQTSIKPRWFIDDDIPYLLDFPEFKESVAAGDEWLTKDEPDTSSAKKYLKFTHTVTATFTAGNRVPTITYDFTDSAYYTTPRYYDQGVSSWSNIYGRIFVPANAKVRKDEWDLSNTDIYGIMNPSGSNYFKKLDGYSETIDPTSDKLHYDSGDYYWAYPSPDYGTNKYYIEFSLAMFRQLAPSESGSTTITFSHIFEFDSENEDYRAFLEAYPNNVEPWYPMVKAVPYRLDFPGLHKSLPGGDIWLIDDKYPYRVDFPTLKESSGAFTGWLQNTGYSPYRPWPNHRTIFQSAEPIEIPEIDWTKGMQQTFEYFKVNPSTWNDYEQITTVISSNITKDTDSEMRGHASIETTEPLDECYIRTYMAVRQNGIKQRICLGTHLYMVQSDSFNGMNHQYNYTGYTPLVELREKLIPLGYSVTGVTGEINGKVAPMLSDEIATLIRQNSRVKLENRVKVEEPLLNNFVAGTTDNILTVVNNLLNASSLQQYQVTVDEFGTVCIKEAISVYNERHVFEYTDDNSSILMADIDLASDLSSIPNVLEVIYAGDANKDIGAVRVVVRNEDPNSVVSTVSRGREVWNRVVISNIGSPYDKSEITRQVVVDQVTNQAYRLLEDASTIRKTIQYEHGYCDVEVGDTVLFNYKRAGLIGIKAKVVSQTITCKPGCKVSEMAVYTKKLWNRGA